jgi:lysophospholipase L1-like esterase
VASDGVTNAERAVDARYHSNDGAVFGEPSEQDPAWLAIEVGPGPSSVLVTWADAGYGAYDDPGQSPVDYVVETSADSRDGSDGEWSPAATVTGNPVRTRGHRIDFSGQSWVRLTVTAGSGDFPVEIDEIAVFDASDAGADAPEDSWFFLGDSITAGAFAKNAGPFSNFEAKITAARPSFTPAVIGGGIGGELARDGLSRLDRVLELNPDITYFGVGYGTNDSWGNRRLEQSSFEGDLTTLVERLLAEGKIPVLARIPYASKEHSTLPEFNEVIDRLTRDHGLPCGPDLYAYFKGHEDELNSDGVHPTGYGYQNMNGEWAEAALELYPEAP